MSLIFFLCLLLLSLSDATIRLFAAVPNICVFMIAPCILNSFVPSSSYSLSPPISSSSYAFSSTSFALAKVDPYPLEVAKLSAASYRGHIKFELVGLKKLIKAGDWSTIHTEIEHYKPLYEPNVLAGLVDRSVSESDAEAVRSEFAGKLQQLDKLAVASSAKPTSLEEASADRNEAFDVYLGKPNLTQLKLNPNLTQLNPPFTSNHFTQE